MIENFYVYTIDTNEIVYQMHDVGNIPLEKAKTLISNVDFQEILKDQLQEYLSSDLINNAAFSAIAVYEKRLHDANQQA